MALHVYNPYCKHEYIGPCKHQQSCAKCGFGWGQLPDPCQPKINYHWAWDDSSSREAKA